MLRATLKSLLSRKARLLLSGIAVILGVTFISGALVLNASLGKSIEGLFTTVYDNTDVQVESSEVNAVGQPKPVEPSVVDQVTAVPGVAGATGLVEDGSGGVQVLDKNNKVLPAFGAPTIGNNWVGIVDPLEMQEGTGPESDDQVAISAGLSDKTGLKLGDTIKVVTAASSEPQAFTISGIFGYTGGRDTIAGETIISFTTPTAQRLLIGGVDGYTTIDVKAAEGVTDAELRDDIAGALGSSYKVQTGEELAEETASSFEDFLTFFNYLLLGFGAVALIVSIFLIINTFSIIVAQRTRELALFRAMGASKGQVRSSVMIEALIIGIVSGVLGLGLGALVGWLGTVVLGNLMGGNMETTLSVPVSAIIAALVIGVGVTMIAAIFPALRASRIPPIAALRDAANTERPVKVFGFVGGILLLGGGALLTAGLMDDGGNDKLWMILGAILVLFIGSAVFTPAIARPLVSAIGQLMSWSLPGKLGRRNSARNPRRTAITTSALMIGIALVTAVGVLFSSAQASIDKFFDNSVKADVLIQGQQVGALPPTFSPDVITATKQISGVTLVADVYMDLATDTAGNTVYVQATSDLTALADTLAMTKGEGNFTSVGTGEVVLSKVIADQNGLKLGDSYPLTFGKSDTPTSLKLTGIIDDGGIGGGGVYLSSEYHDQFLLTDPSYGYVELAEGTDKEAVIDQINGLLANNPLVSASDISVLTDQIAQIFNVMLTVVQILLGLAMFIAVIGVVNTLTLSVLERTRELGLLRAVGLGKGQVTRMVTVESVVISVFGSVLGLAIGAGLGVAAQQALKDQFVDTLAMPWGTMLFYLVAGIVIGVVAALIPAFRANRLNVLKAISYE